jgi:two-component system, NtrC family, sensor histidine kinase HydH
MNSDSRSEESRFVVRPRYLAVLFGALALLFLVTTLFEYRYRKEELGHMMREEAVLLIDAMTESAGQSLAGYRQSQSLVASELLDKLRLLGRMAGEPSMTPAKLGGMARSAKLRSLMLSGRPGRAATLYPAASSDFSARNPEILAGLDPVLSGQREADWCIVRSSSPGVPPLLVGAVRLSDGGVAAGAMDATGLLEFRRTLGIGKLVRSIGADTTGIEYIIWQDSTAVLAATPNVRQSESIRSDPFLSAALHHGRASTRIHRFAGKEVYEVVKPFIHDGRSAGLFRIGLKTDHFEAALKKLRNRMAMIVGLLTIGAVAVVSLSISRRKAAVASDAYLRARTLSTAVLESMADAVVTVDAGMRVMLFNSAAEALFATSGDAARGMSAEALLPEGCVGMIREALDGDGKGSHREFESLAGSATRYFSVHCSLMEGPSREIDGVVCVLRDLSEQRAMRQVIERQEKLTAMGELASGVAHEIRNPLNAIGIIAQRLDMEFEPPAESEEYHQLAGAIVSEVDRVDAIVTRFLKFAAPPRLHLETVALDDFVAAYLPVLRGEADSAALEFSSRISSKATVSLDREQMRQVLINLVRNAAQATAPGGRILVETSLHAGKALIAIADTGSGIPAERLPRIFDLYYTTREEGTGMGLAIANRIVQSHGGAIGVTSRVNEGSRFTISLPFV